ncbi:MAG: T9SS type A sorting domain-containing protein [Crocinitomicaceae bacterium]|nr:T9SS type A sorting domain-containing protein [Crocinitomicaceae bacterium]
MLQNLHYYSRSFFLILALLSFSSFMGFSQTISIGSPNNATEGSGLPASFLISLDNGAINTTGADITGTITLTGTASPGVDYLGPVSFAIANGSNSIGVLVPIVDDALCEGTETIIATISNPNVGSINPANNQTTVLILDDDCATLVVSIGSPNNGVEGPIATDVTFSVFLEGGAINSSGGPITGFINYAGTATGATDYVEVTAFSIPNGSNATTITLPVIDDVMVECDETVVAFIANPSIGTIGTASSSALIVDDECLQSSISIGSPTNGIEGSTSVSYIVSLDNGLINSTGSAIDGSISYAGTATDGTDYTSVASFSIPDGVGSAFVILTVIDDALIECNESVIATIFNPSIGVINPAAGSSTADIIDDECASFGISIGSPTDGEEGGADITYSVLIEGGAVNNTGFSINGTINYSGTATGFVDYSGPLSFSIPNGANSTILTLNVVDDILFECDEDVIATISNPSAGIINNATSTAIIVDDECSGQVTISIVSPMDGEEGGADVSFDITLDGGVVNGTGVPITGDVTFTGTATAGADFSDITLFAIPDGASFVTHVLPVIEDPLDECDETVIATISNPSFATINIATDSATIVDNDCTMGVDVLSNNELKIYPNPVGSSVNFESEIRMSTYAIIDLNGRILSEGQINAKEMQLNTDSLATGSYIVNVSFEDGTTLNSKILKE